MKDNKRKYIFLSLSYALFFVGVGSLFWHVKTAPRLPAAIQSLQSEININPVNETLLADASIELNNATYNLRFSNMGQACDAYDRFSLEFITPNVHTSGEVPTMTIEGECIKTEGSLLSILVPYKAIMQERPGDIDLLLQDPQVLQVKVREVIAFWPEYWVLTKISLINSQTKKAMIISEKEVSKITNNQLSMHWKK